MFVVSLLHFLHERIEYSLALAHHLPQVPAPINQAGAPWPQRGRAVLDGTPSSIICSFPWRSDTTPPHPLLFMGRILMYHLGTKPHVKTYKMFYFTEPVAPGAAARPVWGLLLKPIMFNGRFIYKRVHGPMYPNLLTLLKMWFKQKYFILSCSILSLHWS